MIPQKTVLLSLLSSRRKREDGDGKWRPFWLICGVWHNGIYQAWPSEPTRVETDWNVLDLYWFALPAWQTRDPSLHVLFVGVETHILLSGFQVLRICHFFLNLSPERLGRQKDVDLVNHLDCAWRERTENLSVPKPQNSVKALLEHHCKHLAADCTVKQFPNLSLQFCDQAKASE